MRKLAVRSIVLAALATAFGVSAFAQGTPWQIDPAHSSAQFAVRHLTISTVRGEFSKVTGVVNLDESDLTRSSVEVSIDTTTLNTREPARDADLRSARYFDVAHFPTMAFRSKRITAAGNGRLQMTGDLTIRGVTREATFDVEGPTPVIKDPWGNQRRGASATAKINRKDFGMVWNAALEGGGLVVGEEVAITIDVEFAKKAAPAETPTKS